MPRDRSLNNPGSPHDRSSPGGRGDRSGPGKQYHRDMNVPGVGGGGSGGGGKKGCRGLLGMLALAAVVIGFGAYVVVQVIGAYQQ